MEGFKGGDIIGEVALMHSVERPQEGSKHAASSLTGVAMDFSNAIAVGISCPFTLPVTDGFVLRMDMSVIGAFVGRQQCRVWRYALGDNLVARGSVCVSFHPIPTLASLTADHSNNGRTVIGIRSSAPSFIRPSSRWVERVKMRRTFFTPRFDRVRQLQSACPPSSRLARCQTGWLEYDGEGQ